MHGADPAGAMMMRRDQGGRPLALPLSTAQVGMWFSHQLDPTRRIGTLAERVDIHGPIDPAIWQLAWRQVYTDIDACRVRFVEAAGALTQVVVPPADSTLPFVDLSRSPSARSAAEEWLRAQLSRPMDLDRSTSAFALLKVSDEHFIWYHQYHHIANDYYGVVLIAERLAEAYTALAMELPQPHNPVGRLYEVLEEEAAYHRSPDHAQDRRYWLDRLDGLPAPPDLHGRTGPPDESLRRTTFLPDSLLGGMREVAQQAGTSWARVLMAAAAAYLSRMTGERDILLGLPVACRTTPTARRTPTLQANVVPLRLAVPSSISFEDLVAQAASAVNDALPHQRYRYEDLRRDLAIGADRQLFGWTVNVMSFERELRFAGHPTTRHNLANGPVEDLSIFALSRSDGRGVQVDFVANPSRYGDADVEVHQSGFLGLLAAMVAEPGRRIVELAPTARPFVSTSATAPPATFPALFEASVGRTPDAIALVFEGNALTYGDLNARANRLAHYLIRTGVGPGQVVALACGRTVDSVIGLLAILKAGAAYLPLDVDYPLERIAFLLGDTQPTATLATRVTANVTGSMVDTSVVVDRTDIAREIDACPEWDPTDIDRVRPLGPSCPAYVIYTSGSTGTPNGVIVGHTGLAGLAAAQIERFAIGAGSRVLQFASPGFDGAVAEVVTALASGAALVLAPPERLVPGEPLTTLIAEAGVTHLTLPPTILAAVPEDGLPGVETLVVAGEPCPPDVVTRWAGRQRMINAYGPTEATVCATMSEPLAPTDGIPPIGRPIAGTDAYVLDSALHPVAIGAVGQLYLAGAGLAHGYQGQPALTAERFVADPFGPPGTRMYRTGDLVRWRPDGGLEFVARADRQVALRGFRIEPGEVEAVLAQHTTVAQAAVGVVEGQRLVAYVVPRPGQAIEPAALRRFASGRLPGHLVPSAYVPLDRLPLTPNGKLDRQALSPQVSTGPAGRAPGTRLEELVCGIYAEVLGRTEVGPEDDFFALGGHSLLAMQLVQRLRRVLPVEVSVQTLFQAPTVAELLDSLALPDQRAGVLPIRTGGTRPPLFCLPPASGLSLCYTGLRSHLPPDQPIYGLQSGPDGLAAPSIDRLAADYLAQIRDVRPTGPYHLLGWSFGGHMAHAIATLLRQAGAQVSLLAILDAYPYDPRLSDPLLEALARPENGVTVATMAHHAALVAGHAWPRYDGDLLFFTATGEPASASPTAMAWRPYVGGDIENHDIRCGHFDMTAPEALAAIGAVLAKRLTGRTERAD
jgi:amino acid adenylation domain-containing protein